METLVTAPSRKDIFYAEIASISAKLIAEGTRPTVRAVGARRPDAGNTKISTALRRFWRVTLARVLGVNNENMPVEEETTDLRIAVARRLSQSGELVFAFEGSIIRAAVADLATALESAALRDVRPEDGGGIVVVIPPTALSAIRLSHEEYAFLAGRIASAKLEGRR